MLDFLPWMLGGGPPSRPEYAARHGELGEDVMLQDPGQTARMLAAIICVRLGFNLLFAAPTERLAKQRGRDEQHRDGRKLLEECWVSLGNLVMLSAASWVMLRRNGGCWWGNTDSCVVDWPNNRIDPAVRAYYSLELAWYLHLLLKPVLRYGLPDGRDMLAHHAASLALIVVSYGINLTRMGVQVLALFGVSNPFLHIAKICNQLGLGVRMPAFGLFALLFFVTRVVVVPVAVLKPALLDPRRNIPYAVEDFRAFYLLINALLMLLYVMQIIWFWGILRVLIRGAVHGGDAASRLSAQVDPAKRYAAAAGAAERGAEGKAQLAAEGGASTPRGSRQGTHLLQDSAWVATVGPEDGKKGR